MTTNVLYALKFTYVGIFKSLLTPSLISSRKEGRKEGITCRPPTCKEKSLQFRMSYFLCFFSVKGLNDECDAIMSL
jgi:hypothetical protein